MSWQGAVERTVMGMGYELVDVEKGAGGLLRVYIDVVGDVAGDVRTSAHAGTITVDDCEKVTRQLQHVLEVEGASYERLEVSSPGLDRPLRKAADYVRFAGEQAEVTLKLPFKGRKKYRGELQVLDEANSSFRLVLADERAAAKGKPGKARPAAKAPAASEPSNEQALDFSLDEVREARLVPVVDFKGRRFAAPEVVAPNEKG